MYVCKIKILRSLFVHIYILILLMFSIVIKTNYKTVQNNNITRTESFLTKNCVFIPCI